MTRTVLSGLVAALFTAGLAFGQSPPPPAPAAASSPAPVPPKTVELKDQKGKVVGTVLLRHRIRTSIQGWRRRLRLSVRSLPIDRVH